LLFVLFKPPKAEFHLSLVGGPEAAKFQFYGQKSPQAPILEA
jgi:hypothetical protein